MFQLVYHTLEAFSFVLPVQALLPADLDELLVARDGAQGGVGAHHSHFRFGARRLAQAASKQ